MKKMILTVVLFAGLAGAALFAWEPMDLTRYPSCTQAGDFILNVGVGLGGTFEGFEDIGDGHFEIPPLQASLDYNIAIGDKQLPFFAGGSFGYSGRGYKNDYFYSRIAVGGRFGYHFNWDVDKLDTYAVTTAGWIVYAGKNNPFSFGIPLVGVHFGARWFLTDGFGFWAEVGYTPFSIADIGVTFRF